MRRCLMVFAFVVPFVVLGTWVSGQTTSPARTAGTITNPKMPRTPWGDPDLQGIWTNIDETGTPFERPNDISESAAADEATVRRVLQEREARRKERAGESGFQPLATDATGNTRSTLYGSYWMESDAIRTGSAKNRRLWWVVDPRDGKVPPLTPQAQQRAAALTEARRGLEGDQPRPGHWAEDINPWVRCITRGLPNVYIPLTSNQNFEIVQSPGYVTILYEMIHEARVIPMDSRPHAPSHVRQWLGDSRGRWEGNTLVVDVTNCNDRMMFKDGPVENPFLKGVDENLHLIERFTRVGHDMIDWNVTIDDPTAYTRPWTFSIPLVRDDSEQYIYEYACHEGNYAIEHILSSARARERVAQNGKAPK